MRRLVALAIAAQLLLAQRNAAMPKDAASINAGAERTLHRLHESILKPSEPIEDGGCAIS